MFILKIEKNLLSPFYTKVHGYFSGGKKWLLGKFLGLYGYDYITQKIVFGVHKFHKKILPFNTPN